jgi:RNA polymerase sigma-70 factor, ECF subfamily
VSAKQRLATPDGHDGWGTLIERTARGDASALATLYDGTASLVMGLALRILGDHAVAEEVVSDVYLQVWHQAARWDPERGAPLTWLLTVARSRAIDRLRVGAAQRAQRAPLSDALDVPAAGPGPDGAAAAARQRAIVQDALGRLGTEQREVIELAYFGGLSHGEIAVRTGLPLGTVKTRIRLGMAHLRQHLTALALELP